MEINEQAINSMVKSISTEFKKLINNLNYDKSYKGTVSEVLENGRYKVNINNKEYSLYSSSDMTFVVHDKIWVIAPNNNSNNMYINGRRR